ncbi:MAG: Gfo/Idh/MocA family oxidoreductase, partial [Candidatus Heimdallarchaeota archaeon]|nr:Gfo/Idh/MocA family oxidoreductase [Candidatus Heimdallarchaeota archaeon]
MGLNKLRVAIIGCGRIGTLTKPERKAMMPSGTVPINHAEAIISNTSLQLVALCDVDKANLDRASKAYEVEKCFNDYKALILDVKPDIISIATRTLGRCDIIKFAVENGVKGIHIEKPISTNLAECREVIEVAKKHQVYLTYGTARRFMDIYIRAKEILASGEIGELVQISIELGYTLLLWNHPHSVDMLIFFAECMDIEYV